MKPGLDTFTQSAVVWRGGAVAPARKSISTGFTELDRLLPGGGWPSGAITELLLDHRGIGELRLLVPAVSSITRADGWVVFVAPPYVPYAPALASLDINLNQLIVLETKALKDQWWAAEQALRAGSCSAVVFWPNTIDDRSLRRLQLAAQTGGTAGFVFAPASRASQASPAPLRIKLSPADNKLQADILKRRGSLVETPLLLDLGAKSDSLLQPTIAAMGVRSLDPAPRTKAILPRIKHYPNGGDTKRIWDRVIANGDTVRRSTSDDRR